MRISAFLSKKNNLSRRFVKTLIQQGRVRLGDTVVRNDTEVDEDADYILDIRRQKLDFELQDYLIQDSGDVIFFQKPPLMHSERLNPEDALCLDDIVPDGFELISRLDYGVGGVVPAVRTGLEVTFEQKRYLAWLQGRFDMDGTSNWAVDADKRRKVRVYESPYSGSMSFRRLNFVDGLSLVEVILARAARHQVRAVCAAMGHAIVGDPLYGNGKADGLIMLHCAEVRVNSERAKSALIESFSEHPTTFKG